MARSRLKLAAAAALIFVGFWESGQGAYIHAKAELAQVLLENAWENTRLSGRNSKPWGWADTWPVAKLEAPEHGIQQIVLNGDTGNVLAFGPGLITGSAKPGQSGRVVISGHRDTHFRFLKRLSPGDRVLLQPAVGPAVRYRVTGSRIFDVRRSGPPPYPPGPGLSLLTCYPFDAIVPGGPLRYQVDALPEPPLT